MKKWMKRTAVALLSIGLLTQFAAPGVMANPSKPAPDAKILNVAHRGASGHAPEHTIVAYEKGIEMKADYIEIDLQMTKDGVLIAMHDTTVNRTTNGTGRVADKTVAEIKQLDAGTWFNERNPGKAKEEYVGLEVPTLEEIFQHFGKSTKYYIETKSPTLYPGMEDELLRLMDEYKLTGVNGRSSHVIIQSFHPESLLIIHEKNPNIPLVQLLSFPTTGIGADRELEQIKKYAIGVGPNFSRINESYIQKVRSHGLSIHPYTLNSEEQMRRALEWGVTGVFTDYPDVFRQVIKEYKSKK
ncbi:glycerophosphodiester phosphodiesterase [Alkalihalobacillus sp. LMS39]|uniref:glycerophosphodiester phosphodiesterase n=1 Tax=Alkalihalobacillus sp. LMS39 TaxID=2924032 RepID=UPI001FB2D361|nr:glycerophosphodiester phosphodiesterase [Alkalihalobacillus sp. LMS39]UOE94588.1 glycerophosphodiester phosphodiesterase [Alkalihalobacillus sp. LMS39]